MAESVDRFRRWTKKHKFEIQAGAFALMVIASALLYVAGGSSNEWLIWLLLGAAVAANLFVLVSG